MKAHAPPMNIHPPVVISGDTFVPVVCNRISKANTTAIIPRADLLSSTFGICSRHIPSGPL